VHGVQPLEVSRARYLNVVAQRVEEDLAQERRLAGPPRYEGLILPGNFVLLIVLLEPKHQPSPTLERTSEKRQQVAQRDGHMPQGLSTSTDNRTKAQPIDHRGLQTTERVRREPRNFLAMSP
jgi:hypothetical protein